MSVLLGDLNIYGSQVMPDDDTTLNIGGAIDFTKTVEFDDFAGTMQGVSSTSGDTTQILTITYRDNNGVIQTTTINLNGTTPVTNAAVINRLLKALKNATTAGFIALENQSATRTGTAQGGTANTITLDAGASAVDDFFRGMIIRLTAGTGILQIRKIVSYTGATKVATVDFSFSVTPDATSQFRISTGMYFPKSPQEVLQTRRPFFNAAADPSVQKTYYEKVFLANMNQVTTLSSSFVSLFANPSGDVSFALSTAVNDSFGNGAGNNRQVAPSGLFFSASSTVAVPGGGNLASNQAIGCWLLLTLPGGAAAQNTTVTPQLQGNTT